MQSKWEVVDDEDVKNEAVTSAEIFAETKRIETHKMEQMDDKKEAKPMYLQVSLYASKNFWIRTRWVLSLFLSDVKSQ